MFKGLLALFAGMVVIMDGLILQGSVLEIAQSQGSLWGPLVFLMIHIFVGFGLMVAGFSRILDSRILDPEGKQ